jgi:hypothetical protein
MFINVFRNYDCKDYRQCDLDTGQWGLGIDVCVGSINLFGGAFSINETRALVEEPDLILIDFVALQTKVLKGEVPGFISNFRVGYLPLWVEGSVQGIKVFSDSIEVEGFRTIRLDTPIIEVTRYVDTSKIYRG